MSFDTFAVAAIADELRSILKDGRLQRLVQINTLTYGFEIFIHPIRYNLIISCEPQAPRLHLTEQKVRRGVGHETPLMLVLRKYMRGARLRHIEQPPYERLLYFQFEGPFGVTLLAFELLGTRTNLIFMEPNQTILGVARLPKPGSQSQRQLVPGDLYEPPPPQQKLFPHQLTEYRLREEIDEAAPNLPLVRFLPGIVSGVSPLMAREIVYRTVGDTNATLGDLPALTPLLSTFTDMMAQLDTKQWQPTLAFDEDERPDAFAAFALTHVPDARPAESMSVAIETFFADAATGYNAAKQPLFETLREAHKRLEKRRKGLLADADKRADPDNFKEKGEAILTYVHTIQPGQTEITVDWLEGPLKIALDPKRSPSENAQQYFSRYRKAQRTEEEVPIQLEKIDLEKQYLDHLEQDLSMAENREEIDAIADALYEAGFYRSKKGRRGKKHKRAVSNYLRLKAPAGATVWVGKNALQNAHLTFSKASGEDLWLHARDVPGGHVIIPTAQGLPSEEDVFWAAGVAAFYSKARSDTSVEVDVTLKKYVRAIKGAAPGLVTYRNQSTLNVVPFEPEDEWD